MSRFNAICMRCRDKVFIVPGTENTNPQHAGLNGTSLDTDHTAESLNLGDDKAQIKMYKRALEIIRELAPTAVYADLMVSDQNTYGFILDGLRESRGGDDLLPEVG